MSHSSLLLFVSQESTSAAAGGTVPSLARLPLWDKGGNVTGDSYLLATVEVQPAP